MNSKLFFMPWALSVLVLAALTSSKPTLAQSASPGLEHFVRKATLRKLKAPSPERAPTARSFKKEEQADAVARAILQAGEREHIDPLLLMAVIESESNFHPRRLGSHGELGLMQIRPSTATWLAPRAGVRWHGKQTLLDPVSNIRIGAAYLAYLRTRVGQRRDYYLAAYNMGTGNFRKAIQRKAIPRVYVSRVMTRYRAYQRELGSATI